MKKVNLNDVVSKIKRKNLAKLLGTFVASASLFVPMVVISSCKTETAETSSNNIEHELGIVEWSHFLDKVANSTTAADGVVTYTFDKSIDNKSDIKGFKGFANYKEVADFLKSPEYNTKHYKTAGLKIYFKYNSVDGKGDEITPSMLESIYNVFSTVNITDVDGQGIKTPVKFSSGNAAHPEIFDIEKFYDFIKTSKLTLTPYAQITKSTTNSRVIGVQDPELREAKITDTDKLLYLLNTSFFRNAKLDKINLSGNVKDVLSHLEKEAVANNVHFDKNTFYDSLNAKEPAILEMSDILKMTSRNAKPNLANVKVLNSDAIVYQDNIDFSNSKLNNVYFEPNVNLSLIPFNNVNATGTIRFSGILPHKMRYLNAASSNVVFDRAVVPVTSTDSHGTVFNNSDMTGGVMGSLEIKNITNADKIQVDAAMPKGSINKFKGSKTVYDKLKDLFNIRTDNVEIDILTYLNNNTRFYG